VMVITPMDAKYRLLPTPSPSASQAEGSLWLAVHPGVWDLILLLLAKAALCRTDTCIMHSWDT
jgi:hypothetical protein